MSRNIIYPSLVNEYGLFASTKLRFNALLSPIQSRSYKHSDFLIYVGRPLIDLVAIPSFLLDAVISAFNCVTSLIAAAHHWSSSVSPRGLQSDKASSEARERWEHTKVHFYHCVSALFAAVLNPILSIIGLVTRPISSLVHAVADLSTDSGNYGAKW